MRLAQLIGLVLLLCTGVYADNSVFQRSFPGLSVRTTTKVAEAPDGGVVLVADYVDGSERGLWIIRYDPCDELLWSKRYAFTQGLFSNGNFSITPNNDVLVTGYYFSDEEYNGFLLKVDENGDVVFCNQLETGLNEYIYSIGRLADGNYFLYGNRTPSAGGDFNNFVMRFDENGGLIGAKTYFAIPIWGWTIATSDGGLLARTGRLVYKIDHAGNVEWATSLDEIDYYSSRPVEVADGYVYARYSTSESLGVPAYLIKLSKIGKITWVSEGFRCINVTDLQVLADGGFIAAGNTVDDDFGNGEMVSMYTHVDPNGTILEQWYQTIGNNANQRLGASAISSDGYFYQTGYFEDPVLGGNRLMLNKLRVTDGIEACNATTLESVLAVPPPATSTNSVTPHDLAVTLIPMNISAVDVPLTAETACYEKEPLSINLGTDTVLCPGSTYTIGVDPIYASYSWSTGATTPSITVGTSGTYKLTVSDGCETASDSVTVTVFPAVDYNFEVSPKKASPFAPVRFSAEVLPGQEVYWFYGSGESSAAEFEHTFDQNGKYPVYFRFIDENGCSYYDTTEVTVKYFSLFVPTSFTPDGNGLNDVFQPEGFGIAHYHLTVYNRWGEVVFDRANAPWDGAMEGEPQPSGVYVYQLEVTDDFGEVSQRQGTMTLFR